MGVGPRVDNCAVGPRTGVLQGINECALTVGLHVAHNGVTAGGQVAHGSQDVVERFGAVDFRLTRAKHVQIWAIEHEDVARHTFRLRSQSGAPPIRSVRASVQQLC